MEKTLIDKPGVPIQKFKVFKSNETIFIKKIILLRSKQNKRKKFLSKKVLKKISLNFYKKKINDVDKNFIEKIKITKIMKKIDQKNLSNKC